MKLLNLKAKNLFSIGEISLPLQARGLTLVTGFSRDEGSSNGAGKSSVANKAILWALYGQTAGGIRADSVLNRHGRKRGWAEVDFIGVDGATYTVHRERPAKLSLSRDGADVSAKRAADTQQAVDAALGMNFATFIQTAFFGQGRMMSYASLTPKDQKALLEEILPMEDIDRWAKYADAEVKKLKLDLVGVEREVLRVETEQDGLSSQLKQAKARSEGWASLTEQALAKTKDQIFNAELRHTAALDRIAHTRATYEGTNVELLTKERDERRAVQVILRGEQEENWKSRHEAQESHKQWNARAITLAGERSDLETATACGSCLRPYDDSTVKAVKDRLHTNDDLMAEAELNFTQAKDASVYYDKMHVKVGQEIADLERESNDTQNNIDQLGAIDAREKTTIEAFDREIFELRLAVETREKATNPHLDYIDEATAKLDAVSNEWLHVQTALGIVNTEMEHLVYWRDVYAKELKLKLFETCCDFLDSRTSEHLKGLRNEQLHVEFSTIKRLASGDSKDEFSVHVWSETGGVGFDSLSGGEQQMASFAIGLALADLASGRVDGSSEFLILDEPFSQLDDRNSEAIVEYLTGAFGQGKDTTLLISNEEALKGLIPNRIHVVKHMGITEIDNEG